MNSNNFLIYSTLIILLWECYICNGWNYEKAGEDWGGKCTDGYQSPIDLSSPFTYKKPLLSFSYSKMQTQYNFYNNGNNLILEGDFGFISYENDIYFSSQLTFYSPSTHTVNNKRYPLEMQIKHHNKEGKLITICILFKETQSDYSMLLGKLGFDKEELKNMIPYNSITIKEQINLSKYINDGKEFFIYDSVEMVPPCERENMILILTDILKVSRKQLANFPLVIKGNNRVVQYRKNRPIYLTFKLNDIQEKIEEAHKILIDELERKVEENKITITKQLQELNITSENIEKFKEKAFDDDKDKSPEEIEEELEKQIKSIENIDKATENIIISKQIVKKNPNEVPSDIVIDRAVAEDKFNKKSELKIIGDIDVANNSLLIDKELPETKAKIDSDNLIQQFLQWEKLKEIYLNQGGYLNSSSLVQLNQIEKILKENEYQPYLNEQEENGFSFIQMSNEKKANLIFKTNFTIVDKNETQKNYSLTLDIDIDVAPNEQNKKKNNVTLKKKKNKVILDIDTIIKKNPFLIVLKKVLRKIILNFQIKDNLNYNNLSYYPSLSNSKVKLSQYTFTKILQFLSDISKRDLSHNELEHLLIRYIHYLIEKQNNFYIKNTLYPIESYNNTQLLQDIIKENNELFSYIYTHHETFKIILNVVNYMNISLLDPKTEKIILSNFDFDSVAYEYQRRKQKPKEQYNINDNIGCKNKYYQSPIHIKPPFIAEEFLLKFNFSIPPQVSIAKNDYKIIIKGVFGFYSHNNTKYTIKELQIHFPGEHLIGDLPLPVLEMHIIGVTNKNQYSIIGIPFSKVEENNIFLEGIGLTEKNMLYALKLRKNKIITINNAIELNKLNLNILIPPSLDGKVHYYSYIGSSTSPPCIENVRWFIMNNYSFISRIQLEYIKTFFGTIPKSRQLQPLNKRIITTI